MLAEAISLLRPQNYLYTNVQLRQMKFSPCLVIHARSFSADIPIRTQQQDYKWTRNLDIHILDDIKNKGHDRVASVLLPQHSNWRHELYSLTTDLAPISTLCNS